MDRWRGAAGYHGQSRSRKQAGGNRSHHCVPSIRGDPLPCGRGSVECSGIPALIREYSGPDRHSIRARRYRKGSELDEEHKYRYVYAMKRLVMNIPEELHRRLKIACTLQGKTMTQVALTLLAEFVEKEEKRKLIVYARR